MAEFKTLNGYDVKDATARENITQLNNDFTEFKNEINQFIEQEFNDFEDKVNDELLKKATIVSSLTKLKTLTLENGYYKTNGYYAENDGGAGFYKCRAKQTSDVDNGGSIIVVGNFTLELIFDNLINVKQFGARGNGTSNDSTFIQKAINTGFNIAFPFSRGEIYLLQNTINITKQHQAFYGINNNHYTFVDGCIKLDVTKNITINVDANDVLFENLSFTSTNNDDRTRNCITAENSSDIPNLDLKVKNCDFAGFNYQIYTHGRGVLVDGCTFGSTNTCISLLYDSNSSATASNYYAGGRAFVITNNRFHNVETRCVEIRGGYCTGAQINNNQVDMGRRFFLCNSYVDSLEICSNVINYCNSESINFKGSGYKKNIVISNNTFYNNNDEMKRTYPNHIIQVPAEQTGLLTNVSILNNTFRGCNENAINLRGTNMNSIQICNNNFSDIGLTNAVGCCIRFGSVRKAVIVSNIFVDGVNAKYAIRADSTGEIGSSIILCNIRQTALMGPYEDGGHNQIQDY